MGIVQDRVTTGPEHAELLDALTSALIVTDLDGEILLWNRAAERLYGFGRDEMQGANVMTLLVPPENSDEAASIMKAVTSGESWTGEFPVVCADGSTIRVRITDSPVIRDGEVVAVAGLAEPIDADAPHGGDASAHGLADLDWALAELDGLRTAMATRGIIEQAKGVLIATLGIDATAAFEVLTQMSQRSHRKLVEVAREVVDHAIDGDLDLPRRRRPAR